MESHKVLEEPQHWTEHSLKNPTLSYFVLNSHEFPPKYCRGLNSSKSYFTYLEIKLLNKYVILK